MKIELGVYEHGAIIQIAEAVSRYQKINLVDFFKGSDDATCLNRYLVYTIAYYQFKVPVSRLVSFFGHKQHGTVINGIKRVNEWQEGHGPIKKALSELMEELKPLKEQFSSSHPLKVYPSTMKNRGGASSQA